MRKKKIKQGLSQLIGYWILDAVLVLTMGRDIRREKGFTVTGKQKKTISGKSRHVQ